MKEKKQIISEKEIDEVFGNLKEVLVHNSKILSKMIHLKSDKPFSEMNIGSLFLLEMDSFKKVYTTHLQQKAQSRNKLKELMQNKKFEAFVLKQKEDSRQKNLNLESFLIKPYQRFCKYGLLLRAIIEFTPEDHKFRTGTKKHFLFPHCFIFNHLRVLKDLLEAYKKMHEAVESVQSIVAQSEDKLVISDIERFKFLLFLVANKFHVCFWGEKGIWTLGVRSNFSLWNR